MHNDHASHASPEHPQTVFQKAASDVLAQRLEGIALEMRALGTEHAGIFASVEALGLLAAVLQGTLRRIDEIFDLDGFVFSPACSLLLELFQARTRGGTISCAALCASVNCPTSVADRWITALEMMQLVAKTGEGSDDPKVALTEKGTFKCIEALKLLL